MDIFIHRAFHLVSFLEQVVQYVQYVQKGLSTDLHPYTNISLSPITVSCDDDNTKILHVKVL